MKSRVLETGIHYVTQIYKKGVHDGIDLVDKSKGYNNLCNIIAHSDGEVVSVRNNCNGFEKGSYGNYVKIKHNNGYYTLYAHLKYKSVKVKVGDMVKSGEVIGYMGNTGYSFGGHLHFEVRDENDIKINPTEFLEKDLPEIKKEEFPTGNYKTLNDMYVRYNAGLIYGIKLVKHLTEDGKRNATSKNPNSLAVYKKGTIFTALKIINNKYGVWAKTPSGYVCIKGASGKVYSDKL